MTVVELIEKLNHYKPEAEIRIPLVEYGGKPITKIEYFCVYDYTLGKPKEEYLILKGDH